MNTNQPPEIKPATVKKRKVVPSLAEKLDNIQDAVDEKPANIVAVNDSGMSDRQQIIQRLYLRKFSVRQISNIAGVSIETVLKELSEIKRHNKEKGSNIDRDQVLGEALTVFEEVEARAWEIFSTKDQDPKIKLKALDMIMKSRAEHVNILKQVGLIGANATATRQITLNSDGSTSESMQVSTPLDPKKHQIEQMLANSKPPVDPMPFEVEEAEIVTDE